jgi:putative endonuclease
MRRTSLDTLVHVEEFQFIDEAIAREKQIEGWKRVEKNALVQSSNPTWADLSDQGVERGPSLRSG